MLSPCSGRTQSHRDRNFRRARRILASQSSTIVQGDVECLRSYDLDGDNVEELLVVWVAALNDQSSRLLVRACRGDFDHLLWERPAPMTSASRLRLSLMSRGQHPSTLVLQDGYSPTLALQNLHRYREPFSACYGWEAATGKPLWQANGPRRSLLQSPATQPPRYVVRTSDGTICRPVTSESEDSDSLAKYEAVNKITKLGGSFPYDESSPRRPIDSVAFYNTKVTDAELVHLQGLTQLRTLFLDDTGVTDAGMERLQGFTQLQKLGLSGTPVTDAGLEHLRGLTQLQHLNLNRTGVTDAGLKYLQGLTQLRTLQLTGTKVTDAGVSEFQKTTDLQAPFALPHTQIYR